MIEKSDERDGPSDESDDGEDELRGWYRLKVRTELGIPPNPDESDDFIEEYEGELCYCTEDSDTTRAGEFHATVVRCDNATDAGLPIFDLWDHSQELHELYCLLFNPKTDEFKRSVESRFQPIGRNVLILDMIAILPNHRGKNLGLAVASRLIDVLGRGCAIVVCLPGPMQFGALPKEDPAKAKELALDSFETDRERAVQRLRSYWGQLGFKRLGKEGDKFCLSMNEVRPSIEKLCDLL